MFEETYYLLRLQPSTQRKDEKVVWHVPDKIAVSQSNEAFTRIDSRHFAFDLADLPINHCLSYVKSNVIRLAFAKCKPDQCWVEKKLPAPRH